MVVFEVYLTSTHAFLIREITCRILMPLTAPIVAGLKVLAMKNPSQLFEDSSRGCKLDSMNLLVAGSNT
jgi:thiazole synthase ThiGH ThiG subunit